MRNVALVGHSHEGKTSLAEAMLVAAGALARAGSTEAGTAVMDFEPEEHRRKVSVNLALADLEFNGIRLNLIDTPGVADFEGQVVSALAAAESALVVVSPSDRVAVGTEIAWQRLNSQRLPRLVVINKMDRENADFYGALDALRGTLTPRPVALNLPIGSQSDFRGVIDLLHMKATLSTPDGMGAEAPIPDDLKKLAGERREQLVEAAAEGDDALLGKYLELGTLSDDEVERGLREGVRAGSVCPVLCCSAAARLGVRTLLRTMVELLPAPSGDPTGTPAALIFNTTADSFVGRISYLKVLSGRIRADQRLFNSTRSFEERLGQLFTLRGKEHQPVEELVAGDIGGVGKLAHSLTGDVLGRAQGPSIEFPEPSFSLAILPRSRGDDDRISAGLTHLLEEDPSLRVVRDEVTHEVVASGLGDVHLDVLLEKLKRKYGVEATTRPPQVAHLETISRTARAEGRHVKQSGGHGQYGVCTIEIAPTARGEGFVWEDKVFGGAIPQNFRPSVQKGVIEAMASGVVAGHPMVDVRVTLLDGKYHPVDSSDMAFQLAGSIALRKAVLEAEPLVLEPVLEVQIRVPERCLGDVMSDLSTRRGRISGTQGSAGWQHVQAQVPAAEMQRYALDLRSMTQGRGVFSTAFSHHEPMPPARAQALIQAHLSERQGRD